MVVLKHTNDVSRGQTKLVHFSVDIHDQIILQLNALKTYFEAYQRKSQCPSPLLKSGSQWPHKMVSQVILANAS